MLPGRTNGSMRHLLHKRPADKANALGWRVLWALFAILALCATPLGTGELFAAESHVYERKRGEAQQGDLPARFTLAGEALAVAETLRSSDDAAAASLLFDDTPGTPARSDDLVAEDTGSLPVRALSDVAAAGIDRHFRARAPPHS